MYIERLSHLSTAWNLRFPLFGFQVKRNCWIHFVGSSVSFELFSIVSYCLFVRCSIRKCPSRLYFQFRNIFGSTAYNYLHFQTVESIICILFVRFTLSYHRIWPDWWVSREVIFYLCALYNWLEYITFVEIGSALVFIFSPIALAAAQNCTSPSPKFC